MPLALSFRTLYVNSSTFCRDDRNLSDSYVLRYMRSSWNSRRAEPTISNLALEPPRSSSFVFRKLGGTWFAARKHVICIMGTDLVAVRLQNDGSLYQPGSICIFRIRRTTIRYLGDIRPFIAARIWHSRVENWALDGLFLEPRVVGYRDSRAVLLGCCLPLTGFCDDEIALVLSVSFAGFVGARDSRWCA